MTEAFLLLRQHTCDLAARGVPAAEQQEHTRCLLGRLADWAAERNSAAEPWLNRLTELPFNALGESRRCTVLARKRTEPRAVL